MATSAEHQPLQPLLTRWGREVDPDAPWPEYPRPQMVRDVWQNLNGRWEYAFGTAPDRPEQWDGEIVVPFSPEAPLSGVGRQLRPDEWLFQRRVFTAPRPPEGGRLLLHFGAVDQSCTVWVNDVEVGRHIGGYLPFTIDVTDAVTYDEDTLVVRVRDLSETGPHARGKQRLDRGTIWYTAQSGIWQTVWLEPVPTPYIRELTITPDLPGGRFDVVAHTSDGREHHRRVVPQHPHPWTPEDPHLHHFDLTVGDDTVHAYGALRSFGVGPDEDGRPRLLLNGAPYQHVGVLDQGYWPDGLLTPPSDAAMVHDIATMRSLGFTMLRKHVKVEPLRWYHHCDRLGILVWQDMVNGGGRYRRLVADLPARRPVRLSDRRHRLFHRDDADARAEFRDEVRRTVTLLRNTACIAVWVLFNEGWGQFDSEEIAAEVVGLDTGRQICQVSGWIDQGGGDLRAFHRYVRPWRMPRPDRRGRVIALSEYGGHSLRIEGHDWSDREFGYRRFRTPAELAESFTRLHADVVAPTVPRGLSATVYTQLSDVEDELNGLLTWDREVLKIPADTVRAALALLRPST
ncbi:glycoside hydrolase family 2 protein [Nocardioides terrisoli]|uniref:glycoside hydrolase family 2 protein n=1 Tax=Nocardioides terrisoli TaxID=3388267 RepID=UPI00287B8539|nr:sugar-binding domain-containing protein [Nocardioides marmorisolisilvae]